MRPLLSEEHTLAKKQYLIDEAKNLEKREREDTLKSNELLRNQLKKLAETNNKVTIDKFESERKLLHEKEKSLMDKMDLISKFQMTPVNKTEESGTSDQSQKDNEVNEKSNTKQTLRSVLLAVVISILVIILGFFATYYYQVSQKQQTEIQKVIENQQKTDSEVQKQKSDANSQSKKKAAESKVKAELEAKQRLSEMEKEISSLKAKDAEQSSAQEIKEN